MLKTFVTNNIEQLAIGVAVALSIFLPLYLGLAQTA